MRYYRCKCGKRESWSSMGVRPCDGCPECNTTLEESARDHTVPEPHQFEPHPVETNEGTAHLDRCKWCFRSRREIEAQEAKRAAT